MGHGDAQPAPEGEREDELMPGEVVGLLDAIPGAYERAQLGLHQAQAGQAVSLDAL